MDVWFFQCLLFVSLVLNTSNGYRDIYDQENYNIQNQRETTPNRRVDQNPGVQDYERQHTDDRPIVSERSLPFNANVQRVHDGSRRNGDDGRRNVNSSLKIVHNFAKLPTVSTRRGAVGHSEPSISSGAVVFPDTSPVFVPRITNQECLQTGICEEVPNYPQEKVDEVVSQLRASKYKFNVDRLVTPEIAQRIGPNEEMLPLCRSKETVVAPKAARDTNNKWYNVLNGKNKVLQGYRVEICQPESAPCSDLIYVASSAYNMTCVQKYQYRQMVVLNEDGNYVEKEFKIPSCCACAVYAVSQFGNR